MTIVSFNQQPEAVSLLRVMQAHCLGLRMRNGYSRYDRAIEPDQAAPGAVATTRPSRFKEARCMSTTLHLRDLLYPDRLSY